jgi:hypothetical protein
VDFSWRVPRRVASVSLLMVCADVVRARRVPHAFEFCARLGFGTGPNSKISNAKISKIKNPPAGFREGFQFRSQV